MKKKKEKRQQRKLNEKGEGREAKKRRRNDEYYWRGKWRKGKEEKGLKIEKSEKLKRKKTARIIK